MIKNILKSLIIKHSYPRRFPNCKISVWLPQACSIGDYVQISKGVKITHPIEIGTGTFINENARIEPTVKKIGKFCSISYNVILGAGQHPTDYISTSPLFYSATRGLVSYDRYDTFKVEGETVIEEDVLISANAVVMAGVKLGRGCIVGAGAIVTKDIPPYAIAVGVPAKVVKYRFNDMIISELEKSKWWNLSLNDLKKCAVNPSQFLKVKKSE